ncbi:MAG TPA: hypothetical protein PKA88_16265 [Polyangiaceae bacterium]|nr:hypothetical protein [Polyangiaceae bacterium]
MRTHWSMFLVLGTLLACKQFSGKDEKATAASASGVATAEAPAAKAAEKNPVGGVWRGRFQSKYVTGSVVGMVTESGDARFVTYGGMQFVGSLKADAGKFAGSLVGYQNHATSDTVSLEGTVVAEKSLAGTFQGKSDRGSFQFAYGPEYDRPATLAELADQWGSVQYAMEVNEKGLFQGKDAAGCEYTGALSIAHPGYNAFNLSFSVSSCKYKGEYQGLATLTDQGGPKSRLAYGVSGDNYSHAGVLLRGELLGSAKARAALREAEQVAGDVVKAANKANKAADDANAAADRAAKAKTAAEATKAAGEATKAAGQASKAAGEAAKAAGGLGKGF